MNVGFGGYLFCCFCHVWTYIFSKVMALCIRVCAQARRGRIDDVNARLSFTMFLLFWEWAVVSFQNT